MKIRAVLMDDEMLYVDEFLKALRQNFKNSDIFTEEQEDRIEIKLIHDDDMSESHVKMLLIDVIAKLETDHWLNNIDKTIQATRSICNASLEKLPKPVCMHPFIEIKEFVNPDPNPKMYHFDLLASIIESDVEKCTLKGRTDMELLGSTEETSCYINQDIDTAKSITYVSQVKCDGRCTSKYDVALMLIYRLSHVIRHNKILAKVIRKIVDNIIIRDGYIIVITQVNLMMSITLKEWKEEKE